MLEKHKILIDQYKANVKVIEEFQIKAVVLEFFVVGIVVWMKAIQHNVTVMNNLLATSCVGILLSWYFWDYRPRCSLYEKNTEIVLKGAKMEMESSPLGTFFMDYLNDFSVLGQLIKMALFDLILIYFFSVSLTQLLKSINPEMVVRMRPITPISTLMISGYLVWIYYQPIKGIVHFKKTLEDKC